VQNVAHERDSGGAGEVARATMAAMRITIIVDVLA